MSTQHSPKRRQSETPTQPLPPKLHKSDPAVIKMIVTQTSFSPEVVQQALQEHDGDVTETTMDLLAAAFDEGGIRPP